MQAGAYARTEDAEQQRAKLAMIGIESRLTEREQAGRTVYRVRVGPFERKEEADAPRKSSATPGVDSALVAGSEVSVATSPLPNSTRSAAVTDRDLP